MRLVEEVRADHHEALCAFRGRMHRSSQLLPQAAMGLHRWRSRSVHIATPPSTRITAWHSRSSGIDGEGSQPPSLRVPQHAESSKRSRSPMAETRRKWPWLTGAPPGNAKGAGASTALRTPIRASALRFRDQRGGEPGRCRTSSCRRGWPTAPFRDDETVEIEPADPMDGCDRLRTTCVVLTGPSPGLKRRL
jgi:hypothetical protein